MKKGKLLCFLAIFAILLTVSFAGCATQEKAEENQQGQQENKQEEQKEEAAATVDSTRRGCPACHVKTADKDYSLLAEAIERAKVGGGTHPTTAPDGTKMDENTKVTTCLQCHKPGANGRGAMAPLALRTIVHPAHMGSQPFTEHYRGNCFTCHEVDDKGAFLILSDKVEVTEKGIPKTVPISGAVPPS